VLVKTREGTIAVDRFRKSGPKDRLALVQRVSRS